MSSIRAKLLRGGIWNSVSEFGGQAINFVITILLARLLGPSAFGLIGRVVVLTGFVGFFTEMGLSPTLIVKKDVDRLDRNTVFWGSIGLSIMLYLIVFAAAPLVGYFYSDDRLVGITRVVFISFLFRPLTFVPIAIESKELRYRKIASSELVSAALGGVVGVAMALLDFGVWALVGQTIARSIVAGMFLFITVRWDLRLQFSFRRFRSLLSKGIHFTVNNLAGFASDHVDFLVIGRLIGESALGLYTFALRLSRYPMTKLRSVIGRMLFPAFSSMSDNREKLSASYLRLSATGAFFMIPFVIFGVTVAESLVWILVGSEWLGAVPVIRIVLIAVGIGIVSMGDVAVLMSLNRVQVSNGVHLVSACLLAGFGLLVAPRYGIVGMAWLFVGLNVVQTLAIKIVVLQELQLGWLRFLSAFGRATVTSGASASLLYALTFVPIDPVSAAYAFTSMMFGAVAVIFLFSITFYSVVNFKDRRIIIDNALSPRVVMAE